MTTAAKFEAKMNTMTTSAIVAAIRKTWNMPEGGVFREYGFDIIEQREGEEYADALYSQIWHEFH